MKTFFQITLICCSVIVIKLQGQDWVRVNPVFDPPGNYNTYHGVFVDEKNGWWLSGPDASVWHTTNGGLLWKKLVDSIALERIEFKDTLHGWMVGRILPNDIYNILVTKDGGKSWNRYLTPVIGTITFFDSLNGFAGGDSIYATTDGGITWQTQEVEPGVRFSIMDIYFVNKKNGWAVGISSDPQDAGIILNTTDGGKYWKVNAHPSGVTGYGVYFSDILHGYVVGSNPPFFEGVIKVTSNGGVSWKTHYLPGTWLNDVVFTDDSRGWAVGDYGFIWHTTDRGLNWTRIQSGTTSHLYRIFFFDHGKIGYIFGNNSTLLKYDKTVGIKEERPPIELSFKLHQNYPNPFNPTTKIEFQIAEYGLISLTIYDLLGKDVRTLLNEEKEPGTYTVSWNGRDKYGKEVSSGIYFYQLRTGSLNQSLKMILIK